MTVRSAGPLLAIASGKGGVGKTWLAITLAHALAREGRRVLLFDGDLGLANVDIQLGLVPDRDLAAALRAGETPLAATQHYARGGFDVVAGRSGAARLANMPAEQLAAAIDGLGCATTRYDIVLLDLGAGIDRSVRQLATAADQLLVVATDEPTSLTDAYAVLKLHAADCRAVEKPVLRRIVINQAASRPAGQRSYDTLAKACTNFLRTTPALAAVIRRDEHVREAIRHQVPLLTRSPTCAAAADVEALARSVQAWAPLINVPASDC